MIRDLIYILCTVKTSDRRLYLGFPLGRSSVYEGDDDDDGDSPLQSLHPVGVAAESTSEQRNSRGSDSALGSTLC